MHSTKRWILLGVIALAAPAEARDRQPAHPVGNLAALFPPAAYPPAAIRAGEQGRVVVRVAVDARGGVTACDVTGSSGSAVLDAKTCELVTTRGKFAAGRDEHGKPVASSYTFATRWVLPDERATLSGPWRIASVLEIDRAGKISSCRDEQSGAAPAELRLCDGARQMPPQFALLARGGSTADRVELVGETSFSFDDMPAPAMVYESPGRETVRMSVIHFDVDPDGTMKNCHVVAQSGPTDVDPCTTMRGRFLPIEKARGVTLKMAMSRPSGG